MSKPTETSNPRGGNWNAKALDVNTEIADEIKNALKNEKNMRPRMKAIQGIPYASGAIASDGDLAQWLETNGPNDNRDNSFLKVGPLEVRLNHDAHMILQWQANVLDIWDTTSLYTAINSTAMTWAILGLTEQLECEPEDVYLRTSPSTFNRLARVFWQHMIFDMLVHISGSSSNQAKKIIANPSRLSTIAAIKGTSPVCYSYHHQFRRQF